MKKAKIQIVVFISGLILIELILRILGFQPYTYKPFHFSADPTSYIIEDPYLGFNIQPGQYHVNVNGIKYDAFHNADSLRASLPQTISTNKIGVFGCSYTYGWGVDDSSTFCSQLQSITDSQILNFGKPAYGNIQGYLQLKKLTEKNVHLKKAVFIFCDFHLERNVLSKQFSITLQKGFEQNKKIENIAAFPFVSKCSDSISISHKTVLNLYNSWPLRATSSLVNAIQTSYESITLDKSEEFNASILLFKLIKDHCIKHNIELSVFGITKSELTKSFIKTLSEININSFYVPVNFKNSNFSNLPVDSHPNENGHDEVFKQVAPLL